MASRHRRSILGSLAVLVLLIVVVVAGLFQDGGAKPGSLPAPVAVVATA